MMLSTSSTRRSAVPPGALRPLAASRAGHPGEPGGWALSAGGGLDHAGHCYCAARAKGATSGQSTASGTPGLAERA